MVSGLVCSKSLSKVKSTKPSSRSRRNRYCIPKDLRSKSPKLELSDLRPAKEAQKVISDVKVKSGSWKRKFVPRNSPRPMALTAKVSDHAPSTSGKFRPGTLYSDVLFSGEKAGTLVKIKNLTPRKVGSSVQVSKSHSRSRKRTVHREKTKESKLNELEKPNRNDSDHKSYSPPKSLEDLTKCTQHLMKRLNIDIPLWNFTDFGTLQDLPKFACQFDDYNYLACEKVAFAGLRLASDGKFKS